MKKLKLAKVDFAGAEILTREQLRKVMGGGVDLGSGPPKCSTGPCDFVQNVGGIQTTTRGKCSIDVKPKGNFGDAVYTCYCSAAGLQPVNSNGVSHCQLDSGTGTA